MTVELEIDLGERSYPILIGPGLLDEAGVFSRLVPGRDLMLVTNDRVAPLYLSRVRDALNGRRTATVILPDGEAHKTWASVERIIDAMVAERMNRDATIIALGGGVIGDTAGFAAACYQRGIAYVQLPTTLLAQVDSSVGGKTGINHPGGKNLIGAFHQPRCVIADIATLATLPPREFSAGLAEVVKYGAIVDAAFFTWLEEHAQSLLDRDEEALVHVVRRSCELKAAIVASDEREAGRRALLNFGHTFGHAIETATGYATWLHGEAVAVGMVLAATMSQRLSWLEPGDLERLCALLARFQLPAQPPSIGAARALELMKLDKKVAAGRLRLVLLHGLGTATVTSDFPPELLSAVLRAGFG